ncbi:DUF4179 domain-containing protein [Gemmiger sp.]
MRKTNYDTDLLHALDEQPMPAAPLTDDEFTRVLDAACAKLPKAAPAKRRRFPWVQVAAAAAACVVLGLGSVNFAAPAVAEQLPVVGSLFSWLNRGGQSGHTALHSEQLNQYAETVESTAETADAPYTLTLGQMFNDGDWLRISLMLTSEDDSLADYNTIMLSEATVKDRPYDESSLILDGEVVVSPMGGFEFEKRDDHTFVAGANFWLYGTDLGGKTVTMKLDNLAASVKTLVDTDGESYWQYDYSTEKLLPGSYELTFTVPEPSTAGERTLAAPVTQDDVTVQVLRTTPAATKLILTFPAEQHWVWEEVYTEDGTKLNQEHGFGAWWKDGVYLNDPPEDDKGAKVTTRCDVAYFDAVPENCHSLTIKVYDFDTSAELTTFTVELP